MNSPPDTARPTRSIAARTPSADENTAAGACGVADGTALQVLKPMSSANRPSSVAPTTVVVSTMRPRAMAAASPEPTPTAIENIAR